MNIMHYRGPVTLGHGLWVGVVAEGVDLDCCLPRPGFGVWFPTLSFASARVD